MFNLNLSSLFPFLYFSWNLTPHSYIPISLVNLPKIATLLLHSHDFRTIHVIWLIYFFSKVTVTVWHVTTSQPWHYKPKDPKSRLERFPTERCDVGTVMQEHVIQFYTPPIMLAMLIKHLKRIFIEIKDKNLERANYVTTNKF